ncbi:MAG: TVP38/TMEM64 family protein [Planctomycetales bacterium]|nr:TVP38/TMEM64 family protein [Planctomycetales bacterium]
MRAFTVKRLVVLVLAGIALICLAVGAGPAQWLASAAAHEVRWRAFYAAHPLSTWLLGFAAYVAVTGASLPGAALLSLAYSWFFGFWVALPLISFASTAGATIAFIASRTLLRDWVLRRYGDRLQSVEVALAREGAYYLFAMRMTVGIPYFAINLIMGLTAMPVRVFWWVSQVGMLPGTVAYVYAGSQLPSLDAILKRGAGQVITPGLAIALLVLAVLPLAAKRWLHSAGTSLDD